MFDFFSSRSKQELVPPKPMTMVELEMKLLKMYTDRDNVEKEDVENLFNDLLETGFDMNSVCTSGPLFCFMLDLKPFLSLNVIKTMVNGGLYFNHIYTNGVAHRKVFRELDFNYSDTLWGIFVYLCQHTDFVISIPQDEMFDMFFGRIVIEKGVVVTEFEPPIVVFNVMLAYDKMRHRIKKTYLMPRNFSLRHCIKQLYPLINNAILDS